jgi:four helix bundle protein
MTNWTTFPYEKLLAWQRAREVLILVREARISIPNLRDQALKAATSACLNIAEASGRVGADQRRVFLIARGETAEAAAALDVAAAAGACVAETARAGREKALHAYALLTGLIRR